MGKPQIGVGLNLGGIPKMNNGMHVLAGGTRLYTRKGAKHRDNGPAEIRQDGYKAYFKDGLRHNTKGPAVIHPDGTQEYWQKGVLLKVVPPGKKL